MRARNIVLLIVLLTISAIALLRIYQPRIFPNQSNGALIQLGFKEMTAPHRTHIFTVSTNGIAHRAFNEVKVISVWRILPDTTSSNTHNSGLTP